MIQRAKATLFICFLMTSFFCIAGEEPKVIHSHGFSLYGELNYPADFAHYDYVNPNAPKGGELVLHSLGTFDSLNPFILKGVTAASADLPYESLMTSSADELGAYYGLIAETVEYPEDFSWMIFNLRKEARWHDGKPITSEDVLFSYDTLKAKGLPGYRILLKDIERPQILGPHRLKVRFMDLDNRDLPLVMAGLPVLPKHYYDKREFETTTLEPPLASGPYKIDEVDAGKALVFERVADYWGKDLAVNQGLFNFDRIQIDYYRDRSVAFEAFKSGNYDIRQELWSKLWNTAYDFPALKDNKVKKEVIPSHIPTGTQATFFNLRRPIFQDINVRKALSLVFDFEWLNKSLFFGMYLRTNSVFEASPMAAHEPPSEEEIQLLTPFKNALPAEVFTTPFKLPVNDGTGRIRNQLREADKLLKAAGWHVQNGKRVNQKGEAFSIEMLFYEPSIEKLYQAYQKNLKRLGIEVRVRIVDPTQYKNRLEDFDYDVISMRIGQPLVPGLEQKRLWGSEEADIKGGNNFAGVKNPVIDALVEKLIQARELEDIYTIAKSLDRVLMWNYYFIPAWYYPNYNIAYWDKFSRPKERPPYASMIGTANANPIGSAHLWWYDEEKAKRLEQAG